MDNISELQGYADDVVAAFERLRSAVTRANDLGISVTYGFGPYEQSLYAWFSKTNSPKCTYNVVLRK